MFTKRTNWKHGVFYDVNRQEIRRLARAKNANFEKELKKIIKDELNKNLELQLNDERIKILAVYLEALHDVYGFGDIRMARLQDRIIYKLHCIGEGYTTFADIMENLNIKMKEK